MLYDPKIKPQLFNIHPAIMSCNAWQMGLPMPIRGWWMPEGAGKKTHDPLGNEGVFVGSTIEWTPTKYGSGIEITGDGVTDRINLGEITSTNPLSGVPSGELSVIAKVYKKASGDLNNSYPRIIDKSDSGGAQNGWSLWLRQLITFNFEFSIGNDTPAAQAAITSSDSYAGAGWFDVAATIKSGDSHIYINGQDDTASGGADTFTFDPTTTNAAIGNWNHAVDRQWNGKILFVYVFDCILTPAQIQILTADPYGLVRQPDYMSLFAAAQATILYNFIAKSRTFNFNAKNKTFNFNAKSRTFNFNARTR